MLEVVIENVVVVDDVWVVLLVVLVVGMHELQRLGHNLLQVGLEHDKAQVVSQTAGSVAPLHKVVVELDVVMVLAVPVADVIELVVVVVAVCVLVVQTHEKQALGQAFLASSPITLFALQTARLPGSKQEASSGRPLHNVVVDVVVPEEVDTVTLELEEVVVGTQWSIDAQHVKPKTQVTAPQPHG